MIYISKVSTDDKSIKTVKVSLISQYKNPYRIIYEGCQKYIHGKLQYKYSTTLNRFLTLDAIDAIDKRLYVCISRL